MHSTGRSSALQGLQWYGFESSKRPAAWGRWRLMSAAAWPKARKARSRGSRKRRGIMQLLGYDTQARGRDGPDLEFSTMSLALAPAHMPIRSLVACRNAFQGAKAKALRLPVSVGAREAGRPAAPLAPAQPQPQPRLSPAPAPAPPVRRTVRPPECIDTADVLASTRHRAGPVPAAHPRRSTRSRAKATSL